MAPGFQLLTETISKKEQLFTACYWYRRDQCRQGAVQSEPTQRTHQFATQPPHPIRAIAAVLLQLSQRNHEPVQILS